jgi:hypothetical protein
MGLDISFNRAAADAAGIETTTLRNGDNAQIIDVLIGRLINGGIFEGDDYLAWLLEEQLCLRVPGTGWISDGGIDEYIVRANKWGYVYGPLTEWLSLNGIKWDEC